MPEYTLYWVWLTAKGVITPTRITSLLERFGTIKDIYDANDYRNIPNIGKREVEALRQKSTAEAKRIIEETERLGAKILTYDDESYPEKLLNIFPPPYVLYIRGEMPDIDNILTIAMVGTRNFSPYGKLAATRLARELAEAGAVVVSGMARGADTFAAKAALAAGGKTIAVLGSGLDVVYPPENIELMEDIAANGMVITEYPPGTQALQFHFPQRNRIIAGLSNGVLVTEAPKRSGSLITARAAFDNGREVFAIPGKITDVSYAGANKIIQSYAKLVMSAEDILEEYPYMKLSRGAEKKEEPSPDESVDDAAASETEAVRVGSAEERSDSGDTSEAETKESSDSEEKSRKVESKTAGAKTGKKNSEPKPEGLDETEARIVELLTERDISCDELVRELDLTAAALNVKLTLLEMKKKIKKLPGGRYKLNV